MSNQNTQFEESSMAKQVAIGVLAGLGILALGLLRAYIDAKAGEATMGRIDSFYKGYGAGKAAGRAEMAEQSD